MDHFDMRRCKAANHLRRNASSENVKVMEEVPQTKTPVAVYTKPTEIPFN